MMGKIAHQLICENVLPSSFIGSVLSAVVDCWRVVAYILSHYELRTKSA